MAKRHGGKGTGGARRFPPGGVHATPKDMLDIACVMHKRHRSAKTNCAQSEVQQLQEMQRGQDREQLAVLEQGLGKMGVRLTQKQLHRLQGLTDETVLRSIIEISDSLKQQNPPELLQESKQSSKREIGNPKEHKNRSTSVSSVLEEECKSSDVEGELAAESIGRRRIDGMNKTASPAISALLKVQPDVDFDPSVVPLVTPKSPRKKAHEVRAAHTHAGREAKSLLGGASGSRGQADNCHQPKEVVDISQRMIQAFGQDTSRLNDLFEAHDGAGSGSLDSETFLRVLREEAGVQLSRRDFATFVKARGLEQSHGVGFRKLVAQLRAEAKAALPDGTVHQVDRAQKRSLQMQRLMGESLLRRFGSKREAFKCIRARHGALSLDAVLQTLSESAQVSHTDVQLFRNELKRLGAHADEITEATFHRLLFGRSNHTAHGLWEDDTAFARRSLEALPRPEATAPKNLVLQQLRGFVEQRKSVRHVFLQLDNKRAGQMSEGELSRRFEEIGVASTPSQAKSLARAVVAPDTKQCTFSSFVAAIQEKDQGRRDLEPKKKRGSGSKPTSRVKTHSVLEVSRRLGRKSKTSAHVFLRIKQGEARLSAERLAERLESVAGVSIDRRELISATRRVCEGRTDNITLQQFNALFFEEESLASRPPPNARFEASPSLVQTRSNEAGAFGANTKILHLAQGPPPPPSQRGGLQE